MSATASPARMPSAFARKVAVACVASGMLLCVDDDGVYVGQCARGGDEGNFEGATGEGTLRWC